MMDYPTAVLLKTLDDKFFSVAAVTNMDRGNDNTGENGPCAASPGANPGPCDLRRGFFSLASVADGLQNGINPTESNVLPWQSTPIPVIDSSDPVDPNDPNSAVILDVSWSPAHLHSDGSAKISTNPTMAPSDPNSAPGVGVLDISVRFNGLVRYVLEVAPATDPNFVNPISSLEITATSIQDLIVPPDSCLRAKTVFGKKPQSQSISRAICRLGRCGDVGYQVVSTAVCLGEEASPSQPPPEVPPESDDGGLPPPVDESQPPAGEETEPSPPAETTFEKIEAVVTDAVLAKGTATVHIVLEGGSPLIADATEADLEFHRSSVNGIQQAFIDTLPSSGIDIIYRHKHAFGLIVEIDSNGLAFLETAPEVKWVYLERVAELAIGEGVPLVDGERVHGCGLTGDPNGGPAIAVLDSGIDWRHVALGGCFGTGCKVAGGTNCIQNPCNPSDPNVMDPNAVMDEIGHGTWVAGVAGAKKVTTGPNKFFEDGMLTGGDLVAVKIASPSGGGTASLERGLDWVFSHRRFFGGRRGIRVVNISMTFGSTLYNNPSSPMCSTSNGAQLIQSLRSFGVAVVAGSGNMGATNGVQYPACVDAAIAVAASYDADFGTGEACPGFEGKPADPNTVWCDSNTGALLDLVAPGPVTETTDLTLDGTVPNALKSNFGGTSAATAYVSGAIALMFANMHPLQLPSVTEVESQLNDTGLPTTHKNKPNSYPRIKIGRALGPASDPDDLRYADPNDSTTLSWDSVPDADFYNVYRGQVAQGSAWAYNHTCEGNNLTGLTFSDSETPSAGDFFYYLATAATCLGETAAGSRSNGNPRLLPSPCP